jgi:hypothetical protein
VLGLLKINLRLVYLFQRLLQNIVHKVYLMDHSPTVGRETTCGDWRGEWKGLQTTDICTVYFSQPYLVSSIIQSPNIGYSRLCGVSWVATIAYLSIRL